MQELIQKLTNQFGVSEDQASSIIETVNSYSSTNNEAAAVPDANKPATAQTQPQEGFMQKATEFVEDHIPGGLKEKAEDALGSVGEKLKGFFK